MLSVVREPWMQRGMCFNGKMATELFFPHKGTSADAEAKLACGLCPVSDECLEFALTHNEHFGIWGGKTERQRRRLRAQRRLDQGRATA